MTSKLDKQTTVFGNPDIPFHINSEINFKELTQWHYWEMRKRLFLLNDVDEKLRKPALEYLHNHRFYLLFENWSKILTTAKADGLIDFISLWGKPSNFEDIELDNCRVSYPKFLPFLKSVAVYPDRIEYCIDEPSKARHNAVRLWAVRGIDAFSDEMKVKFIDQGVFDIPDSELKADYKFTDLSTWLEDTAVHSLREDGIIKFHTSPFERINKISEDEVSLTTWESDELEARLYVSFDANKPIFLGKHPSPSLQAGKDQIYYCNGQIIHKNVLGFVLFHTKTSHAEDIGVETVSPVWINLTENSITFSRDSHVVEFRNRDFDVTLIRICNFLYYVDDDFRAAFIKLASHHNKWLELCFKGQNDAN